MGRRTSLMPGSGPGQTVRRAGAVVLAASGVVLVVAGLQVCPLIARPLSELMSFVMPSPNFSCPVSRPPELWWTAAFMQLGALVLWLPPQRGRLLWRRPFLRLMTRRRIGSVAGTVLMAIGVGLILATAAGAAVDGRFSEQGISDGLGAPLTGVPAGLTVVTALAAIWWGAIELRNADRRFQDRLVFLIGAMGTAGLATTVLGDLIDVGWPGFGRAQLAVAVVFVLSIGASVGLAQVSVGHLLPTGPVAAATAGAVTVGLMAWMALEATRYRQCLGLIGCDPVTPAFGPRVVVPLAAVALYLMLVRYRHDRNLRAAYRDETQFVPISTI